MLILALFGLEMSVFPALPRPGQPTSAVRVAPPGFDPRLVIPLRTLRIGATFADEASVSGTLYPAVPGVNTLRLTLGRRAAAGGGGRIDLVATMPGMAMAPVTATLRPHGHGYSGVLVLPMFGRYRVRITIVTPAQRSSGLLAIALTLPAPSGAERTRG